MVVRVDPEASLMGQYIAFDLLEQVHRLFLLAYNRFQSSYVRIFYSKIVGYFVTKCRGYSLRCIYKTLSFWSAFVTSIYILPHRFTTQRNCSVITKYNVNKHFIISMYLC